jgi:hypothetical protein
MPRVLNAWRTESVYAFSFLHCPPFWFLLSYKLSVRNFPSLRSSSSSIPWWVLCTLTLNAC